MIADNDNRCNVSFNGMHSPEWYVYERCKYCLSTEDDLPVLVWLGDDRELKTVRTSQLQEYDSSFGNLND